MRDAAAVDGDSPTIPISLNPEIQKSGSPPFLQSTNPEILDSGNPSIRQSENPLALSIARWLLVAALLAAPWVFGAVETWAWVALGLVASIALLLWGFGTLQQRTLKLIWSPLFVPVGLFFLVGALQYAGRLSLDWSETRQALVLLAIDSIFFFLGVQLFAGRDSDALRRLAFAVLILAGALGLFAILQFASGEQQLYGTVPTPGNLHFGTYVNPNHFAGLMEMLIPVAVFYIPDRPDRFARPSLVTLAWLGSAPAIAVASLLLSGSKAGLLALGTEAVIAMAVCGWRARYAARRSLAAAVVGMILAAVLLFSWVDPGLIAQRLELVTQVGGPAWMEWAEFRKHVASDSIRMLFDSPAGVGLGNFETAYPRYQSFPSDFWIDYAHNDYVQAIAETGLMGAALILLALALFLRLAFGRTADRRQRIGNSEQRASRPQTMPPGWRRSEVHDIEGLQKGCNPQQAGDAEEGNQYGEPKKWYGALFTRCSSLVTDHSSLAADSTPGQWIRLGAALACCGMLVHSFFDFNLHIPANAAWFAILAAIAVGCSDFRNEGFSE